MNDDAVDNEWTVVGLFLHSPCEAQKATHNNRNAAAVAAASTSLETASRDIIIMFPRIVREGKQSVMHAFVFRCECLFDKISSDIATER